MVAMVAETANKLSRREVTRRLQALWDRGLTLVLGYLRSTWDQHYRFSGSGVKYLKDLFYKVECGGQVLL